jgi:hypothetical protein
MKLFTLVLAFAVAAGLPGATISFRFNGVVNGATVGESLDSGATFTDYGAGQMSLTVTGTSGFAGPVPTNFFSFCIEPLQGISAGTTVYTFDIDALPNAPATAPLGNIKADLLLELFGRYYTTFQQSLSVTTATALQIAIWEINQEAYVSGTPFSVSTGVIRYRSLANPDIITEANNMLASLNGTGPMLTEIYALRNAGSQDLAFRAEVGVPEPATLGTFASGLLLVGAAAARRRRGGSGPARRVEDSLRYK